jgi:hypothetical protein
VRIGYVVYHENFEQHGTKGQLANEAGYLTTRAPWISLTTILLEVEQDMWK